MSSCAAATKAHALRAHAPQQDKPLQWEACSLQQEQFQATPKTQHNQKKKY